MLLEPNRLASYIASKICHDLVSPLGAASSALDFMGDSSDAEMREQAEQLLISGTTRGLARLQFLRYAFGSMGLSDGAADMHEAKSIMEGYIETHKGRIVWNIQVDSLSFSQIRTVMNMIMLAISCLARDGVIEVDVTAAEGSRVDVVMTAKGPRARLAPDVTAALNRTEPEDGWNPRTIQPYFTTILFDEVGATLASESSEDQVKLIGKNL